MLDEINQNDTIKFLFWGKLLSRYYCFKISSSNFEIIQKLIINYENKNSFNRPRFHLVLRIQIWMKDMYLMWREESKIFDNGSTELNSN